MSVKNYRQVSVLAMFSQINEKVLYKGCMIILFCTILFMKINLDSWKNTLLTWY